MAGELDQLAMLRALTDDKANAKRIGDLHDAMLENQRVLDQIREQRAAVEEAARQAAEHHKAARAKLAECVAREQALDEREARLAAVNESLTLDQTAFNDTRKKIEADLAAREQEIATREANCAVVEDDIGKRLGEVTAREKAIEGLHESLTAKHEALRAIVAA